MASLGPWLMTPASLLPLSLVVVTSCPHRSTSLYIVIHKLASLLTTLKFSLYISEYLVLVRPETASLLPHRPPFPYPFSAQLQKKTQGLHAGGVPGSGSYKRKRDMSTC